jgi:hypothetical protein
MKENTNPSLTIRGTIGRDICLDTIHFLSSEYRNTTWTCVGYEILEHTRNMISESMNEIFGINPQKLIYEKMAGIMEYQLAMTISRSFSDELYLTAFDFMMHCKLEYLFSDKILLNEFLTRNCNAKNVSYVINTMRDMHFYKINVLNCPEEMLEWLNSNYTTKFYNKVMQYADNLISVENGYSLSIDPEIYNGVEYFESNLKWLGNYISAALDTLNQTAKINAKNTLHRKNNRKSKKK